jgi:hypothetical protein
MLVEIDGQGHVVQHSAARAVAAEIIAFTTRTARRMAVLPQASDGSPGKLEDRSA